MLYRIVDKYLCVRARDKTVGCNSVLLTVKADRAEYILQRLASGPPAYRFGELLGVGRGIQRYEALARIGAEKLARIIIGGVNARLF